MTVVRESGTLGDRVDPLPAGPFPQIERYECLERLGEGATAVVYRAWDRQVGRPVALKMLRETGQLSLRARRRFLRESQVLASIAHPHVVTLHDVGDVGGELYLVMELVPGR